MGFFFVAMTVLTLIYSYIGFRIIPAARLPAPWSTLAWAVLALFLLILPLGMYLRFQGKGGRFEDVVSWIAYPSLGFATVVFALLVVRDVGFLTVRGLRAGSSWVASLSAATDNPGQPDDPDRRRFLLHATNLAILGATGVLTGYGVYAARNRIRIVDLDVPIAGLPRDFEGFRIVQITDIHTGLTIKRDFVQRIVDQVNALSPDLVALTGDLVDGSVPQLRHDVSPIGQLSAPHGTFFVTGNHEYYSGVAPWLEEVQRLGLRVLMNEHTVLEQGQGKLILAGVPDITGGQFAKEHFSDPQAALREAPEGMPRILLAHQPRSVFKAARAGYDLMICGHTHGGQYFPWNHLVGLVQPYVAGLHKHDDTWIYVSRGTGYWGPPMRVGAPAEITVLRLTKDKQA